MVRGGRDLSGGAGRGDWCTCDEAGDSTDMGSLQYNHNSMAKHSVTMEHPCYQSKS